MHLTVQRVPREVQADAGVALELTRLAAAHVGVKHHAKGVVVLEQHGALPGLAVGVHGRHHHGGGVGQLGLTGLGQPFLEQL
ncbi:hypothetical protein D3C79_1037880 [compost metagenome]